MVKQEEENKKEVNEDIERVKRWLSVDLKLEQYVILFIEEGYDDMDTIIEGMTDDELLQIGINKRGHRKKIMLSIQKLRKANENNDLVANAANSGQEEINYENDVEGANIIDTAQNYVK